ncbi:MAG: tRNA adenosine(34) deaminase TadA [Candidatus Binatia bacterium]
MEEGAKGTSLGAADDDVAAMQAALAVARQAAALGEVPVGAVLVRDGSIVSRAHNAPIGLNDPTAHAEILALRAAARHVENYRLSGTTLYVTAEPCMMCIGALVHARVARVVFGCREPCWGAVSLMYDVGRRRAGNHWPEIRGGVCAAEASDLLQGFFRMRRGA